MMCQLVLDWKTFAAIGGAVVGIILASKLVPDQAKEVLIHMVDVLPCVSTKENAC